MKLKDLLEQDGVFIKKFSDEEVNGKVYFMYGDTKVYLGKMKRVKKMELGQSGMRMD